MEPCVRRGGVGKGGGREGGLGVIVIVKDKMKLRKENEL